jgi:hypothetical protein
MPKFRKKPVVIEAIRFTGENYQEVSDFMHCQYPAIHFGDLLIGTLEGTMKANPGDWVIRGIKGEYYPCKPDIFETTYEPVES